MSTGRNGRDALSDFQVAKAKQASTALGNDVDLAGRVKDLETDLSAVEAGTGLEDGAVTTAKLDDGALSADAAGLGKMADGFLADSAAARAKMADGFLSADAAGRAKMADGFLSADAAGRAKMADGFIDNANIDKIADGAITAAKLAFTASSPIKLRSAVSPSTAVAGTGAEVDYDRTITIPAGELAAGSKVIVDLELFIQIAGGADNLTFSVYFGTELITGIMGFLINGATMNTGSHPFRAEITIETATTARFSGWFVNENTQALQLIAAPAQLTAFNVANPIVVKASQDTAASNTTQLRRLTVTTIEAESVVP